MSKHIPIMECLALHDLNPDRFEAHYFETPTEKTNMIGTFVPGGWSRIYGLFARPTTKDEIMLGIAQHDAYLKSLSDHVPYVVKVEIDGKVTPVTVNADSIRVTLEAMGKPNYKYRVVDGHRRLRLIPEINTVLRLLKLDMITTLPVEVKDMTDLEFTLASVMSNVNPAQKAPGLLGHFKAAATAVGLGANENTIRRMCGSGQKVFELATLRNEALADSGRDLLTDAVEGKVDLSKLDAAHLRKLRKGDSKAGVVAATLEARLEYVTNPPKGDKPAAMMSRKDIERLAEGCPVAIVKLVLRAVLSNSSGPLTTLVAKASEVNAATRELIS